MSKLFFHVFGILACIFTYAAVSTLVFKNLEWHYYPDLTSFLTHMYWVQQGFHVLLFSTVIMFQDFCHNEAVSECERLYGHRGYDVLVITLKPNGTLITIATIFCGTWLFIFVVQALTFKTALSSDLWSLWTLMAFFFYLPGIGLAIYTTIHSTCQSWLSLKIAFGGIVEKND